jgi:hypothetical protein
MNIEQPDDGFESQLRRFTAIEPKSDPSVVMYRCGWEAAMESQASRFSWKTFGNGTVLGIAASLGLMLFWQRGDEDMQTPIALSQPIENVNHTAPPLPFAPESPAVSPPPVTEHYLISRWLPNATKYSISMPTRPENGLRGAAEIAWQNVIADNRASASGSTTNKVARPNLSSEDWLRLLRNASPEELPKLLMN